MFSQNDRGHSACRLLAAEPKIRDNRGVNVVKAKKADISLIKMPHLTPFYVYPAIYITMTAASFPIAIIKYDGDDKCGLFSDEAPRSANIVYAAMGKTTL